jgi:hypothetical protein
LFGEFPNLCWNLQKYNEGSIFGEWLQLSNYSDYDELLKAMKELHKDKPTLNL